MNKKWLTLGSSVILAVGAWILIQNPEVKEPQVKKLVSDFDKEEASHIQKLNSTAKKSSQQTVAQTTTKQTTDIYQNFRNDDVSIADANEANRVLSDMYIASHRTEEAFVFDEAKYGTNGSTYYKFQQTYEGLEVYGAEVAVQVSSGHKLESIIGKYSTSISISTKPSIAANDALDKTLNAVSNNDPSVQKVYQAPELMVYMDYDDVAHLAYESVVKYEDTTGDTHIDKFFSDAHTGDVIDSIDRIHTERDIDVYTLNGNCVKSGSDLPGQLARSNDTAVGKASVDNAYDYLNDSYFFYKQMFNRASYDTNDAVIVATVDATISSNGSCSGLNAFFTSDDKQLLFGTGDSSTNNFASAADIVAHELTHAVTWKESNLEYKNESGALNESLSDIFGVTVQAWVKSGGGSGGNPSSYVIDNETWILGEQLNNTKFERYLNNPTEDDYSTDNYEDRKTGSSDNGYVHSNSGITNLSYALLVSGGSHPKNITSVEVPGIGMDKAIRIWYEAQTTTMGTRTDFDNIRASLANAATSLYDECSPEYKAVQLSMDAVKMPGTWECAEADTTAPTISSILPANGATDLDVSTVAKVTFDEPMDADTINTSNLIFTDANGASVDGSLSTSAQTVTFTPSSNLAYEATYSFTVTTGVSDLAGNTLVTASSTSFTTGAEPDTSDKVAPEITSVSPSDASSDVAKNTKVVVDFSEAVDADTLSSAFTLATQAGVNVTGLVSVSGAKATFTPSNELDAETTYVATVSTGAKDLAGNTLATETSWNFTTQADAVIPDDEVSLADASFSASSQYNYSYVVNNIADGDLSTEWVSKTNRSGYYNSEWIQIDLAKVSNVNSFSITWNGYYFPKEMQLWGVVNGSWIKLTEVRKTSAGATTFSVNENVEALHLSMRGGRFGSWFVIKEISID